jgi:hypothetical protein
MTTCSRHDKHPKLETNLGKILRGTIIEKGIHVMGWRKFRAHPFNNVLINNQVRSGHWSDSHTPDQ